MSNECFGYKWSLRVSDKDKVMLVASRRGELWNVLELCDDGIIRCGCIEGINKIPKDEAGRLVIDGDLDSESRFRFKCDKNKKKLIKLYIVSERVICEAANDPKEGFSTILSISKDGIFIHCSDVKHLGFSRNKYGGVRLLK